MQLVASTLHTTSEHGVSSITTADAHTSAASSRLNWRPTDDLNGLVRFAERRNLASARVPSHFNWPVQHKFGRVFSESFGFPCLFRHKIFVTTKHYYLLTHSMQQSPSSKANSFSASQEIPRILWNPNVPYLIHKWPTPVRILSQLDPVHTPHPTSWRSILILSSHLCLGLPSFVFPSGFPTKTLYTKHYILICVCRRLVQSRFRILYSSN